MGNKDWSKVMAYQGRGSKAGNKIVAKSVKEQGGKAAAAKNAVKAGANAALFTYNPNKVGKVVKAVKAATKTSKAVKGAQASKAAVALPSKIVTKGATYNVSKTATGKVRLTTNSGNVVTFPKGTTAQQIATKMQEGKTLFTPMKNKGIAESMGGKVSGKLKRPKPMGRN